MTIRSTFKDFYDSALAYGHDPHVVFERKTEAVFIPHNVWPYGRELRQSLAFLGGNLYVHSAVLLFCGRAYPLWYINKKNSDGSRDYLNLYDYHRVEYFEADAAKPEGEIYQNLVERRIARPFFVDSIPTTVQRMRESGKRYAGREGGENILIGIGAPYCIAVWLPSGVLIIKCPRLQDYGFQKECHPYEAFQNIEMFLGKLAVPDTAPLQVGGDEVIARQKGFDEQSFRTAAPGAKKLNRAQNKLRKRGLEP